MVPFRGNGNGGTRNVHHQLGLLGGTGHWWSLEYMFFCEKPTTCFWLPTPCTLHVVCVRFFNLFFISMTRLSDLIL